jgi:hypothetical protein
MEETTKEPHIQANNTSFHSLIASGAILLFVYFKTTDFLGYP